MFEVAFHFVDGTQEKYNMDKSAMMQLVAARSAQSMTIFIPKDLKIRNGKGMYSDDEVDIITLTTCKVIKIRHITGTKKEEKALLLFATANDLKDGGH